MHEPKAIKFLPSTNLSFAKHNVRVTVLGLKHVGRCNDEQKLPEISDGPLHDVEKWNIRSLAAGESHV